MLGTSAGELFVSQDGGKIWAPLAHLGAGDDLVIDHIVFDPTNTKIIYAAGWGLYHDDEGDVFRSDRRRRDVDGTARERMVSPSARSPWRPAITTCWSSARWTAFSARRTQGPRG